MKFCLIYNKKSAGGKKSKFIKKIFDEIAKKHEIDLFETTSESHASEIIKEFKDKNYERLLVAGGDGSVSFAINELIKNNFELPSKFAIGYIPAGTANILQAELGMSNNIKKIVNTLMSNNLEKTNLVRINDKHFILMAGLGWDAQIVQSINTTLKKFLGKIIFGIKGFQKFIFMDNKKIRVTVGNENILADWVLCSNSKYYAGHHSINNTNIFDNKVVTYIFKDLKRMKLLYYIFLILVYGDLSRSNSIITRYDKNLHLDGLGNLIPIQIDGDNFGNFEKIDISISDKKFNILKAA
jgi:diacylglycerol kinase family enzyme